MVVLGELTQKWKMMSLGGDFSKTVKFLVLTISMKRARKKRWKLIYKSLCLDEYKKSY